MKITDVQVVPSGPAGMTFVEVETDAGITGIGATQTPPVMIGPIVGPGPGSLAETLVGRNALEPRRIWREMFRGWQAQRGRGDEGGLAVNAMACVDMALWDITGKALNTPLHRLLGGALVDRVMVYASCSGFDRANGRHARKSAATMAAEAALFAGQGFKAIKIGWGNHFTPEDMAKVAAVRDAVGPDVHLMFDFGCPAYWTPGWTPLDAVRVCDLLEEHDAYFVEELLPPQDVDGHAAVTQATSVRIASGESLTTVREFRRFIEARALDILQPDAKQMGITQFVDVVRAAEEAGLLVIPHSPWSALAVAAHVQILSTVGNAPMVEYPALESYGAGRTVTELALTGIIERPLEFDDGYVKVSDEPGLGLGGFVHEAVARMESAVSAAQAG